MEISIFRVGREIEPLSNVFRFLSKRKLIFAPKLVLERVLGPYLSQLVQVQPTWAEKIVIS